MKNKKKFWKRTLAFLLTAVITVTGINAPGFGLLSIKASADSVTTQQNDYGWKIANEAMKYLGYGYSQASRSGANGTFDCSGLTWTVLKDAGFSFDSASVRSAIVGNGLDPNTYAWTTDLWDYAISNRDLTLSYGGNSVPVVYSSTWNDYVDKKEHLNNSLVIYVGGDANTDTMKASGKLKTGDIVITHGEQDHAQIVLGTYPYSGDSQASVMSYFANTMGELAAAFPSLNSKMASGNPVLNDVPLTGYSKTGALNNMGALQRYGNGTYAGQGRFASQQSNWLALLNLSTGTSVGNNTTWVIDDASPDSGVRITNKLQGKTAVSPAYAITLTHQEYALKLSVRKEDVSSHTALPNAEFTLYTDAACTNPIPWHDRDNLLIKPAQTTNASGLATWVWDEVDWTNASIADWTTESKTLYLKETTPPTGYETNSTVVRINLTREQKTTDTYQPTGNLNSYYVGNTQVGSNAVSGVRFDGTALALVIGDEQIKRDGTMSCGITKVEKNTGLTISARFDVSSRNGTGQATPEAAIQSAANGWSSAALVNTPYTYEPSKDGGATIENLTPGTYYYAKIFKEREVVGLASGASVTLDPNYYAAVMSITVSNDGVVTTETTYRKSSTLAGLYTSGQFSNVTAGQLDTSTNIVALKVENPVSNTTTFTSGIYKYGNRVEDPIQATFQHGSYCTTIQDAVTQFANPPYTNTTNSQGYLQVGSATQTLKAGETRTLYKIYHETAVVSTRTGVTFTPDSRYFMVEVSASADRNGNITAQSTKWYVNNNLSASGWTAYSNTRTRVAANDTAQVPNATSTTAEIGTGIYKYGNNNQSNPLDATFKVTGLAQTLNGSVNNWTGTAGSNYANVATGSDGVWLYTNTLSGLAANRTHHRYKIFQEVSVRDDAHGISYTPDPAYYLADMYVTIDADGNVTAKGTNYYSSTSLGEAQKSMSGWTAVSGTQNVTGVAVKNINNAPAFDHALGFGMFKTDDAGNPVTATFAVVRSDELASDLAGASDVFAGTDYSALLDAQIAGATAQTFMISGGASHIETFARLDSPNSTLRKVVVLKEIGTEANHTMDPNYYLVQMISKVDVNTGEIQHYTRIYSSADGATWTSVKEERWDAYESYTAYANANAGFGFTVVNPRLGTTTTTIGGKKVLNTDNARVAGAGEFTFDVTQTSAPSAAFDGYFADQSATNDANGDFVFPDAYTFTFDPMNNLNMAGEWKFLVTERKTGSDETMNGVAHMVDGEIIYGNESYELTITVSVNTLTGAISANKSWKRIENGTEANADEALFNNYYKAEGTASLGFDKEFEKTLKGGEFTFDVECTDTTVNVPADEKAAFLAGFDRKGLTNDQNGKVQIPNLTFEKNTLTGVNETGTYTFRITERNDGVEFVNYDPKSFEFQLDVSDDTNGNLVYRLYDMNGTEITNAASYLTTFENTYKAEGEVVFEGVKEFEGLKADQFGFILENVSAPAGVQLLAEQTVRNDANGAIEFAPVSFAIDGADKMALGKYTFRITEISETETGVVYSKQSYLYEVTVSDEVTAYDDTNAGKLTVVKELVEVLDQFGNPVDMTKVAENRTLKDANGKEITLSLPIASLLTDVLGNESYEDVTEEVAEKNADVVKAFRKTVTDEDKLSIRTIRFFKDGTADFISTNADLAKMIALPGYVTTFDSASTDAALDSTDVTRGLDGTDFWFINRVTELRVFKADALTGEMVEGAELALYAIGNADASVEIPALTEALLPGECQVFEADSKMYVAIGTEAHEMVLVKSWTSGKDAEVFTALSTGEYVLVEVTAPDGYKPSCSFGVSVGEGTTSVTMTDFEEIKIHTTATDAKTETHEQFAEEEATLVDKVSVENLIIGKNYRLEGKLYDSTGNPVVIDGKEVTASKTFTYEDVKDDKNTKAEGNKFDAIIEMTFTYNAKKIAGTTTVVFEDLYVGEEETPCSSHASLTDKDQTVYIPDVHTTAKDAVSLTDEQLATEKAKIIDTCILTNLSADESISYKLEGILMSRETGEAVKVNGKTVTAEKTFTVKDVKDAKIEDGRFSGSIDIEFTFDSTEVAGQSVTVFERLYDVNANLIGSHTDITSPEQTVNIPSVQTQARDGVTHIHEQLASETAVLEDLVKLSGLKVAKEYKLIGVLYIRETGEALLDKDGKPVTAEVTFDNTTALNVKEENGFWSGMVEVVFHYDSTPVLGKTTVVFEDLYNDKGIRVGTHNDLFDDNQSVKTPQIGTTATDAETGIHTGRTAKKVTINDVVSFTGLSTDAEYLCTGTLMDAQTGKPVMENGKPVTAETTFKPETENGTVTLSFTFDATFLKDGESVVVFEEVSRTGRLIAVHTDIEAKEQTVTYYHKVPEIGTTATDKVTGTHTGERLQKVTVVDRVQFKDLQIGENYTCKGVLMDKSTGSEFLDKDGKPVTAEKTFKAETENGEITLEFTFDATLLKGTETVVFERLYLDNTEVATHTSLSDSGQTVRYPEKPKTPEQPKTPPTTPLGVDEPMAPVAPGTMLLLISALAISLGVGTSVVFGKKKREEE